MKVYQKNCAIFGPPGMFAFPLILPAFPLLPEISVVVTLLTNFRTSATRTARSRTCEEILTCKVGREV